MTTALVGVLAGPTMAANVAITVWNAANPGDAETATGTNAAAILGSSLDGITISVSAASRATTPNGLSEGNITITNTTNTVQTLDIIAGANGFLGSATNFLLTGTIGVDSGSATLGGSFFADATNSLNGSTTSVTGTDIGDFLSALLTGPHSFSFNGSGVDSVLGPYGMAETLTLTLQPGAIVGVQNVSMDVSGVPEPGTWAMGIAGFGLLGLLGLRRKRRTPRFAV